MQPSKLLPWGYCFLKTREHHEARERHLHLVLGYMCVRVCGVRACVCLCLFVCLFLLILFCLCVCLHASLLFFACLFVVLSLCVFYGFASALVLAFASVVVSVMYVDR